MACKSYSIISILRRLSSKYACASKLPVAAPLQSRLFSQIHGVPAAKWTISNSILPRMSVAGIVPYGNPANNCRNYARSGKAASEDDEEDEEDFDDDLEDSELDENDLNEDILEVDSDLTDFEDKQSEED